MVSVLQINSHSQIVLYLPHKDVEVLQAGYESQQLGLTSRQLSLPWPSAFLGVRCIRALERIRSFVVVQRHVYENMSHILGRHAVSVPYRIARGTLEYSMDLLSGNSR